MKRADVGRQRTWIGTSGCTSVAPRQRKEVSIEAGMLTSWYVFAVLYVCLVFLCVERQGHELTFDRIGSVLGRLSTPSTSLQPQAKTTSLRPQPLSPITPHRSPRRARRPQRLLHPLGPAVKSLTFPSLKMPPPARQTAHAQSARKSLK